MIRAIASLSFAIKLSYCPSQKGSMSLLAEQLVEEWMIRQGFFTVRGLRDGVSEIDLLGVRKKGTAVEGWHIEAQVSFRPVSYVTPLTDGLSKKYGKKKTSAWKRSPSIVRECVEGWIEKKFDSEAKRLVREKMWPGIEWQKILVHGFIKNGDEETELSRRLKLISFHVVLHDVCFGKHGGYPGAVGADIAEIVGYFEGLQSEIQKRG
jgi:hypothetical protein